MGACEDQMVVMHRESFCGNNNVGGNGAGQQQQQPTTAAHQLAQLQQQRQQQQQMQAMMADAVGMRMSSTGAATNAAATAMLQEAMVVPTLNQHNSGGHYTQQMRKEVMVNNSHQNEHIATLAGGSVLTPCGSVQPSPTLRTSGGSGIQNLQQQRAVGAGNNSGTPTMMANTGNHSTPAAAYGRAPCLMPQRSPFEMSACPGNNSSTPAAALMGNNSSIGEVPPPPPGVLRYASDAELSLGMVMDALAEEEDEPLVVPQAPHLSLAALHAGSMGRHGNSPSGSGQNSGHGMYNGARAMHGHYHQQSGYGSDSNGDGSMGMAHSNS